MKKIFTFIFVVAFMINVQAQKFGYVNSQQVLLESPDIKSADTELQTYQATLVKGLEGKIKSLEAKYNAYVAEANKGTLSKVQMQQQEGEIQLEEQNIKKEELEIQQKLLTKRDELYRPVLEKIKNVLDALGKENGYTMIFDSSAGGILHATEADDLMPLLRQKLGI